MRDGRVFGTDLSIKNAHDINITQVIATDAPIAGAIGQTGRDFV